MARSVLQEECLIDSKSILSNPDLFIVGGFLDKITLDSFDSNYIIPKEAFNCLDKSLFNDYFLKYQIINYKGDIHLSAKVNHYFKICYNDILIFDFDTKDSEVLCKDQIVNFVRFSLRITITSLMNNRYHNLCFENKIKQA